MSGWTFTSHQSPLSDFSKAVDLSAEFPYSTLKRLPEDVGTQGTATPAEHIRHHHELATGNRSVNQVPRGAAAAAKSPISPADLQREMHDEAEAILSDFRENLSRSMAPRDSANACPSIDHHGSASVNSCGIGAGPGTTPSFAETVTALNGIDQPQESFPRREPSLLWSAGVESAEQPARNAAIKNDASADSRARGPQRRLDWDEELPGWGGGGQPQHGHAAGELSASRSQTSQQQHSQQHAPQSSRDGAGGSAGKRTPIVAPKRLNLVMPTAASTPASVDTADVSSKAARAAFDTGGSSTGHRSGAGICDAGLPNAYAAQHHHEYHNPLHHYQEQRTTPLWEQAANQPHWTGRQLHAGAAGGGLDFASLLVSPLTLSTPYSLQSLPAESNATTPCDAPAGSSAAGVVGFPPQPREQPQVEWEQHGTSSFGDGRGLEPFRGATPHMTSWHVPQQGAGADTHADDDENGGEEGAQEQNSSPVAASQLTPQLMPEPSVTPPDWASGGRRSSASTRRTLPTPPSEATFSRGRFRASSAAAAVTALAVHTTQAATATVWPDVTAADDDGEDVAGAEYGGMGDGLGLSSSVAVSSGTSEVLAAPAARLQLGRSDGFDPSSGISSPLTSALQHTDLSNLLDTSPSSSVAFGAGGDDEARSNDGHHHHHPEAAYNPFDGDLLASGTEAEDDEEQVQEDGAAQRSSYTSAGIATAEGGGEPVQAGPFGRMSVEAGQGCPASAAAEGQSAAAFSDLFQGETDSCFEPGDSIMGPRARMAAAAMGLAGRWAATWLSEESSFAGSLGAVTYTGGIGGGGSGSDSEAGAVAEAEGSVEDIAEGSFASVAAVESGAAPAAGQEQYGDSRTSGRSAVRRFTSRSRSRSSEREHSFQSQKSRLHTWRRVQQVGADGDDDEEVDVDGGAGDEHEGDGADTFGDDGGVDEPALSPSDGSSPVGGLRRGDEDDGSGGVDSPAAAEPSLGLGQHRGPDQHDMAYDAALPTLRNLPSYEVSWASETDRELAAELSRGWGSTASRRGTRDTEREQTSGGSPVVAAAVASADDAVSAAEQHAEAAALASAAAAALAGAKARGGPDAEQPADVEPPADSHIGDVPQVPGGTGFAIGTFSFPWPNAGAATFTNRAASPNATGGDGAAASAAPATSAVVSDWSFTDAGAILYNANGYRSTGSSTEFYGVGVGAGSGSGAGGRQPRADEAEDLTPRAHSAVKTIMSWQIQENPAFEEDLDAVGSCSQLGDEPDPAQMSPLHLPTPRTVGGATTAAAAMGATAAPQHANNLLHHHHPKHQAGVRVRAPPAAAATGGPAWTPTSTAATASSTTPWAATFAALSSGAAGGADENGGADSDGASSGGSSDSDSPRISALNRVLASGGLATTGKSAAASSGTRLQQQGHRRRGGGALHDPAAAAAEDDVDDRRDTASASRAFGSHGGSASLGLGLPAMPGSSILGGHGGGGVISAVADADDRSLLLELEHAQALLLQALAAAGEPPLFTPPPPPSPAPPPPAAASHQYHPNQQHHGALVVVRSTAADDGGGDGSMAMPGASSASGGTGALRASPCCSSGSSGGAGGGSSRGWVGSQPLVAQVATAAVGKALARVAKLSRENQGLQRLTEQLRSELSHSSNKHMELQARSKVLHTMLAESGRDAEKKAAQQQRRFLRMETHLSGCHSRIRELERINTQLSLEGRQAARQLEAAQAQAAEANLAAGALRGQVAALEGQVAVAHAAIESERRLAEALAAATEDAAVLRHRVGCLEERLGAAQAAGEAERRESDALRGQLTVLEGQLGATRTAAGEERAVAEAEVQALRTQVAALQADLAGACGAAAAERAAAEAKAAELRSRAEEMEERLAAVQAAAAEEQRGLAAVAEVRRGQMAALEEQLRAAHGAADAERRRMEAEAASEVEQLLSACAGAEARAQELEAALRSVTTQAQQVPALEAQLAQARAEVERLQAAAEDAATEAAEAEAQLSAELQAARVAMAELAAERSAARAKALRKEDDAQRASLAAQEARDAAELAAGNYARMAAEAREAEARHAVAMAEAEVAVAELRRQLDAAAWEAAQLTSEAAAAEARAVEAEGREREMLQQLRGAVEAAESAREEAERAREDSQQAMAQTDTAKEAAAELELALVAESARVLEESRLREQAQAAATQQLVALRQQLATAQEASRTLTAERDALAAAQEQLQVLLADLGAARRELECLRAEREGLVSERDRLVEAAGAEVARLGETLADAEVLRHQAVAEAEARGAAVEEALRAALAAAEARLAEAEATHGSVCAELEGVRRELAEARDVASWARSRLEGAEQDKVVLAERVRQLRGEMEEAGGLARGRLEEEESRATVAEAALEDARREQLLLRDNLDNLAEDLAAARAALLEREATLADARREAEAAGGAAAEALAAVEARAEAAEAELEAERCRAADLEAEMQVAMRKLVELQKAAARAAAGGPGGSGGGSESGSGGAAERSERLLLCGTEELVVTKAEAAAEREAEAALSREASRRGSQNGDGSQPGSQPDSPALKLAGDVVAARAELADLRRLQADAEELIGELREQLASQASRCGQLEAAAGPREAELAAARRERQEALMQLQLQLRLHDAAEAAPPAAVEAAAAARPNPWRTTAAAAVPSPLAAMSASAVFSSVAWSPSSSLRVERASMVLMPSPTRSSMIYDSSMHDNGFGWLRGGGRDGGGTAPALPMQDDDNGGAFGGAYGATVAAVNGFAVSATPVSLWVEPGSVGEGRTLGTLGTTPLGGATPLGPLASGPPQHGRYFNGGDGGAAHSPDASISLCTRGGRGAEGLALGGGCYSADVDVSSSPQARGFEPLLRTSNLTHQLDGGGFRTSYGSMAGGGGSPTVGGAALGSGASGAASVCGGGGPGSSGGMQLMRQLFELRYAVQHVEQAAGELAAVLRAKGGPRGGGAAAAFSTPTKISSGSAGDGTGNGNGGGTSGSCLVTTSRLSLAVRPGTGGDAGSSETALQERAWLVDSLSKLTKRAGAVAAQLSGCLEAAEEMTEGNAAALRGPGGSGSGPGPSAGGGSQEGQRLLSPLAIRVLEAELGDLREQAREAQRAAAEEMERQAAKHAAEVSALVAETERYRLLLDDMRQRVGQMQAEADAERSGRREQREEARLQSESQQRHHLLALQAADQRCREQEATIAQLAHHLQQAREREREAATAAGAMGSGRGDYDGGSHRYGGHGQNSQRPGCSYGGPSTHRDRDSAHHHPQASSASIGETCPSTQGGGGFGGGLDSGRLGGGDSHDSAGSNFGGGGGGYYGVATAAAGAAAVRALSPVVSAASGSLAGTSQQAQRQQFTPNSADSHHPYQQQQQRALVRMDLLSAEQRLNTQQNLNIQQHHGDLASNSQRHSHGGDATGRQHHHDGDADGGPSEDETRLWLELLQLLKAAEGSGGSGGGGHSRGTSAGSSGGAVAHPLLALTSGGAMQLANPAGSSGGGSVDLRCAAAAAAVSSRGRSELLARAMSHMSLQSSQNRKLRRLLKDVATGRREAAPSQPKPHTGPGPREGAVLLAQLEAVQREHSELKEKYQQARVALAQSERAVRRVGAENKALHAAMMGQMEERMGALQARSAAASEAATATGSATGTAIAAAAADNDEDDDAAGGR